MVVPPNRLPHQLDEKQLTCLALIETPAGSRAKFDFDPETGLYKLHRMLPAGMAFPLDFGFIPSTLGGDGDPLDVIVLAEEVLPVGCLVELRLLGVIEAEQTQELDGKPRTNRNDRLVGRLAESRTYASVETLDQLGTSFTEELTRFFTTYNELQGKRFEVLAVSGPKRAAELIKEAKPPEH
jgi:inorganic pyrophosphatase